MLSKHLSFPLVDVFVFLNYQVYFPEVLYTINTFCCPDFFLLQDFIYIFSKSEHIRYAYTAKNEDYNY